MIPVTFTPSFGWYHEAAGDCGIVLCHAQNHEDLSSHKAMRLIADAFAAKGYPTLRFDYAGTGDSLGSDRDPDRVEAWLKSIEAAVSWLRTYAKVEKVVLVGLRLGSALASLAAERLGTISGLILFAPVVSGRAYMHELSSFSNLMKKPDGAETISPQADVEIVGFIFTRQTAKDINAIDLTAIKKPPAPKALVVAVKTQASAGKLIKSWSALGTNVERQDFIDYDGFMLNPMYARFPAAALQHALDWLAKHFPIPSTLPHSQTELRACLPLEADHFIETPVFFDSAHSLFGITCVPKQIDYNRPVLIYLNAGANHHIGWGRTTVEVCRKLAESGLVSMRIDIAAIGDSADLPLGPDQILYRDESTKDVSAAVDWLAAQGFHNVVVIGLCAGAHLSFHSALADRRVSRIIMVNIQKYVWHQGNSLEVSDREAYQSTRFYLKRLFTLETWRRLSRGDIKARGILLTLLGRLRKKADAAVSTVLAYFGRKTSSEIATVKSWMRTLDARSVQQHYIFSVGDAGLDEFTLYRQIKHGKVLKAPHVYLTFIENADHNLTQHAARDVLIDNLKDILAGERDQRRDDHMSSGLPVFTRPSRARSDWMESSNR